MPCEFHHGVSLLRSGLARLAQFFEVLGPHRDRVHVLQFSNPANVYLAAGGTLDMVAEAHGGAGVGRISYAPGLRASLKRGEDFLTYRFEVPEDVEYGTTYLVSCHGHDTVPSFHFTIEVGAR